MTNRVRIRSSAQDFAHQQVYQQKKSLKKEFELLKSNNIAWNNYKIASSVRILTPDLWELSPFLRSTVFNGVVQPQPSTTVIPCHTWCIWKVFGIEAVIWRPNSKVWSGLSAFAYTVCLWVSHLSSCCSLEDRGRERERVRQNYQRFPMHSVSNEPKR